MHITVERTDCTEFTTPLLAVNLFQGESEPEGPAASLDEKLGGEIRRMLERGDFRGREGETTILYPRDEAIAAERILLVGLGKREELDAERLRRAAATAVKGAASCGCRASPPSCTTRRWARRS